MPLNRPTIFLIFASLATFNVSAGSRTLVRRSAPKRPKWITTTPPADATYLYFTGFTSGLAKLDEARDQAVHKAMAEIINYFGQKGETTFLSKETETQSEHRYSVSLTMRFEGVKMTVRGISVADIYYEEYETDKGPSIDCYTLVRYPLTEYRTVLADLEQRQKQREREQRERAGAALEKYIQGTQQQQREGFETAVVSYQEALDMLSKLTGVLPLHHSKIHNTTLLRERIQQELAKVIERRDAVHRTMALHVACTLDDQPITCEDMDGALVRFATDMGFQTKRAFADAEALAALAAGKPGVAESLGKAAGTRFVLVGVIRARHSSEAAGIFHARAEGTLKIIDATTGKSVAAVDLPSIKGAHLNRDAAARKAIGKLKKKAVIELRKMLRRL